MIDIHCHILPGIDDGPRTMEEAVAMARIAAEDGITKVVAAPHLRQGLYEPTREQVMERTQELRDSLEEAGIAVDVIPALDTRIEPDLVNRLEKGDIPTIGDQVKYVLLELPGERIPSQVESLLHECLLKKFVPIVVHPERVMEIQNNLERLEDWIAMGVLIQITGLSLLGGFGKKVERAAKKMLEYHLCHLIASEAHSADNHPPMLTEAVRMAGAILDDEDVDDMVNLMPARILAGEFVNVPEPAIVKKRRWWQRL